MRVQKLCNRLIRVKIFSFNGKNYKCISLPQISLKDTMVDGNLVLDSIQHCIFLAFDCSNRNLFDQVQGQSQLVPIISLFDSIFVHYIFTTRLLSSNRYGNIQKLSNEWLEKLLVSVSTIHFDRKNRQLNIHKNEH